MRSGQAFACLSVILVALAGCTAKSPSSTTTHAATASATAQASTTATSSTTGAATTTTATTSTQAATTTSSTETQQAPANHPPTATIAASVQAGGVPLLVNFTLDGADADGQNVTYTFDADGAAPAEASGSLATLHLLTNFTYATVGLYNATLTVSDGLNTTVALVSINATAAAGPTGPRTDYTCTVTAGTPIDFTFTSGATVVATQNCTYTSSAPDVVLVATAPAASCKNLAGGNPVALNTAYPAGTEFTQSCDPGAGPNAKGSITLAG